MVLPWTRRRQIYGLAAVPGFVVVAFALLAVRVPDVVRVLLLKLVPVDVVLLREFLLPEPHGLIESETNALEEESELEASIMFEVVLIFESRVEGLHARRHLFA